MTKTAVVDGAHDGAEAWGRQGLAGRQINGALISPKK
jgi:hypothetical protein